MADFNFWNADPRARKKARQNRLAAAVLGASALLVCLSYALTLLWQQGLQRDIRSLEDHLGVVEVAAQRQGLHAREAELAALQSYSGAIDGVVRELRDKDVIQSGLIERFNALVPPEVTLTNLRISAGGLSFGGSAAGWDPVLELSYNLKQDDMFQSVEFSSLTGINPTSFSMSCTLAEPAVLFELIGGGAQNAGE